MTKPLKLAIGIALWAGFMFVSFHPETVFTKQQPGLMPAGWGTDRLCFRWSPDTCYQHWIALWPGPAYPRGYTGPPPETPLCRYGQAGNSPRCDVRFSQTR